MSDEPEAETADESATETEDEVATKDEVATEDEVSNEDEVATEADEPAEDGFGEGDFVTLAYTARTAEGGDLVDTTDREIAEDEGIAEEGQSFEPRTIVLRGGHIFADVEDELMGGEIGDTGEVTIPAADAFGEYDEDDVRTISAGKLPEDDRFPGARVDVDGEHGQVVSVIGGRARVDFNHPLAGEDLVYEYEIVGEVTDPTERAEALLGMYVDADLEMWIETDEVEEEVVVESDEDDEADEDVEPRTEAEVVEKETLYVESVPQLSFDQQWMFQKQQIAQDIMDRLELDRVIIQETIDGSGGMMGGMGGMMPGMGGGDIEEELEDELEDVEVDADDVVEELENAEE